MASRIKQKIIIAAAESFAETGVAATSTKEIAKRAGVNETSLFRLFGSKQDLMAAAVEYNAAHALNPQRILGPFLKTPSFRSAVYRLADTYAKVYDRAAMRASYFAWLELPQSRVVAERWFAQFLGPIAQRIRDEQRAGRARSSVKPEVAALALNHMIFRQLSHARVYGAGTKPPLGPLRSSLHALCDLWLLAVLKSK